MYYWHFFAFYVTHVALVAETFWLVQIGYRDVNLLGS